MKPQSFPLKSDGKIDMLTSAMTYHASYTHRDMSHDIEARVQISYPLCMGIKCPANRGKAKGSNARGMPREGDVEALI